MSRNFLATVGSRSLSAEGETEAGVEHLSGYPLPARQDLDLDLDLDNSRQEPEAITATSGCALRKSGEPTLEGRYCVGLSN